MSALDGLTTREEGYTESGGGDGLNLQVAPYYANSLRGSLGSDFKSNFDLFGATISPEARLGYRYDLVNTPVKLKAGFVSTGGLGAPNNVFTFVGPDPDTGNAVAGLSLGAGTDTWSLGRQLRLDTRQQWFDLPGRHPDFAGPESDGELRRALKRASRSCGPARAANAASWASGGSCRASSSAGAPAARCRYAVARQPRPRAKILRGVILRGPMLASPIR